MGGDASASGGRRVFKALGAIVLIIFTWLLLIGTLGTRESGVAATVSVSGNRRHVRMVRREKHSFPWNPDLVYVSKRRVPNGPDPIHNRHVGETRRPSGRF